MSQRFRVVLLMFFHWFMPAASGEQLGLSGLVATRTESRQPTSSLSWKTLPILGLPTLFDKQSTRPPDWNRNLESSLYIQQPANLFRGSDERKDRRTDAHSRSLFQENGSAAKCFFDLDGEPFRTLLQINGTTDDVIHANVCPSEEDPNMKMVFSHASSNMGVLNASIDANKIQLNEVISGLSSCRNISVELAFDNFAGETTYTISVTDGNNEAELCQLSIEFRVAGVTIVTEASSGQSKVISGYSGGLHMHYTDVINSTSLLFNVFIQYPDGLTSESRPASQVRSELTSLKIVAPESVGAPVSQNSHACPALYSKNYQGPRDLGSQLVRSGCGAGFVETHLDQGVAGVSGRSADPNRLQFGLNFNPFRAGYEVITIEWEEFTSHDLDFVDEIYTNVISINITGPPPPAVLSIDYMGPLFRSGGDLIQVQMANTHGSVSRVLLVNGNAFVAEQGSYEDSGDGIQWERFMALPGEGANLTWDLAVEHLSGTFENAAKVLGDNDLFWYEDKMIRLDSIDPPTADAGDVVMLRGYFDGFSDFDSDPREKNAVYFGNHSHTTTMLSNLSISPEGEWIRFSVPNRREVGSSFDYKVRVLVNGQFTNQQNFIYRRMDTENKFYIQALGTSWSEKNQLHEIGACSVARFMLNRNASTSQLENLSWSITEEGSPGGNLLNQYPEIATDSILLTLPQNALETQKGPLIVQVVGRGNSIPFRSWLRTAKISKPKIGVAILQPEPRSIRIPDTPLRLNAVVELPGSSCYNESNHVIYEWTVGNVTKAFSYLNITESEVGKESLPARLGREYVIPQSKLQYGDLQISVRAYMAVAPDITGTAKIYVPIEPPALVARIGSGQKKVAISIANNLFVTGDQSYDPDDPEVEGTRNSSIEIFQWTCLLSTKTVSNIQCGTGILPDSNAESFTINNAVLKATSDAFRQRDSGNDGWFTIQLSLRVGKDLRWSEAVHQIVEVDSDSFPKAILSGISITDAKGVEVDRTRIPYYADFLISPQGNFAQWKFVMIRAYGENNLLTTSNVINHPGYYLPGPPDDWQQYPLGISANVMSPGKRYEFHILTASSTPGIEQGVSVISLVMQEMPTVIFPDLLISTGTPSTLFIASASVNLDSSYTFLYFFYVMDSDGNEFCLDGCSGAPYVEFYLANPGLYSVACHLVDSLGKTTLGEPARNNITITVTSEASERGSGLVSAASTSSVSSISSYDTRIRQLHHSGDHGSLELLVSTLSGNMRKSTVVASSESDYDVLELSVAAMHQIIHNSAPTTRTSKSYVQTAIRFASLDSDFFASDEVMYRILSMVDKSIANVPASEAFDIESELESFFGVALRHVLDAASGFTARVRLGQFAATSGLGSRSLVVDFFRLQQSHISQVLARNAVCGMVKTIKSNVTGGVRSGSMANVVAGTQHTRLNIMRSRNTGISTESGPGGLLDSAYTNYVLTTPQVTSVTVGVFCNPDQSVSMHGDASSFQWCETVYANAASVGQQSVTASKIRQKDRRIFTLMESLDYVWLSGLAGDPEQTPTLTKYLVSVNVSSAGEDALMRPVSAGSPGCFKVVTTMPFLGLTPNRGCSSAEPFSITKIGDPFAPKVMLRDYQRNFENITAVTSTDNTSLISIHASEPGVFGAVGKGCPTRMVVSPRYETPENSEKMSTYMLVGIGAVVVVGTVLTWATINAIVSSVT